jgi:hypothetical protein
VGRNSHGEAQPGRWRYLRRKGWGGVAQLVRAAES